MSTGLVERYSTTIDIYSHRQSSPRLSTMFICFKVTLLASNLLFMIFACILLGLSAYALNSDANDLVGHTLPTGLIVMGVFMLLLSAVGAVSAWKESIVGLAIYLFSLLLITIVLFSIGIAVVVEKNKAGEYIKEAWLAAPPDVLHSLQTRLECCGLTYFNESAAQPCPEGTVDPCYPELVDVFEDGYQHAGAAGIAFSVLMGVGIALVVCLMKGIRAHKHEQNMQHMRQANNLAFDAGGQIDLDGVDPEAVAASSLFDKGGFKPEQHNPPEIGSKRKK